VVRDNYLKIILLYNLNHLHFSLKKILPNKTLIIGIMKYPKLASIILSVATAYIQIAQLIKIRAPEINK